MILAVSPAVYIDASASPPALKGFETTPAQPMMKFMTQQRLTARSEGV